MLLHCGPDFLSPTNFWEWRICFREWISGRAMKRGEGGGGDVGLFTSPDSDPYNGTLIGEYLIFFSNDHPW